MKLSSTHRFAIIVFAIFFSIVSFYSCHHEPTLPAGMDTICFDSTILNSILLSSCATSGCHDSISAAGHFIATSYPHVMEAVKAGNAQGSKLYRVITDFNGENFMPPGHPLSMDERMLIEIWIEQGAPNKLCSSGSSGSSSSGGTKSDSVCFVQTILPLITTNCANSVNCHVANSIDEDAFPLIDYPSIWDRLTPKYPMESPIYTSLLPGAEDPMPLSAPPLSSSQIALLNKWITDGALNSSCQSNSCDTSGTISYNARIKSIIDLNCGGCHKSGTVVLVTYSNVKYYAITNKPSTSTPFLTGVINHMSGFLPMPASKLDACTIRMIELWISQGTNP